MYREDFCTLARRMLPMPTSRKGESHGRVKIFLRHVGVFLCFFFLGLLQYRPIWHFRDGIILGHYADGVMNAFQLWWMQRVVLNGLWPFMNPYLYHPVGAEMYWHTLAPIKAVWGVVLLPFFEPVAAENLLLFGTFVVTGFTTWLFLRYIVSRSFGDGWRTSLAAFAGACVFLLSPYLLVNVVGHINLLSVEGIPLFLLFYFKYKHGGERRYLLFAGFCALYIALSDYYYLVYIGMFMFLDMAYVAYSESGTLIAWQVWKKEEIRRSLSCALSALLFISPILLILLKHAFPAPLNFNHSGSNYPLDPVGLLLPGGNSFWFKHLPVLWQQYVLRGYGNGAAGATGYFLGWMTPIVAFYAAYRTIGEARRFLAIGLVFLLLSFGPFLSIGQQTALPVWMVSSFLCIAALPFVRRHRWVRDLFVVFALATLVDFTVGFALYGQPARIALPLPYIFFQNLIPFFGRGGMPSRFIMMFYLALAVCFALSAAALAKRRFLGLSDAELLLLAFLLPNLEYMRGPIQFSPVPRLPEAIAEQIRAEPPDIAVFTDNSILAELEVTQHEHPVSFARLSREPLPALQEHSKLIYQVLWYGRGMEEVSSGQLEEMRAYLRDHHFKYFISHRMLPARDAFVRERLGGVPLFLSSEFQVYQLYE